MKKSPAKGNVLVYLVVLILLFGVIGVVITSLFTASTSSSATPNQVRRAYYVTESAMRYAFSELRNSDFDLGVINTLNTTTYNLIPEGSFSFNIFGPWFDSDETKDIPDGTGGTLALNVPQGELTDDWMAKNPNGLWAVNYDAMDLDLTPARNPIVSWTKDSATKLTITVNGDFNVNKDDRICLAVTPTETRTINDGGDLYVQEQAKDFFPENNGAININRIDYVYKRLVHEPASSRAKLEYVTASAMPNVETPFPLTVENTTSGGTFAGDFIVLSPRNHIVIPTGTADVVTVSGTLDNALNIYDLASVKPMTSKPDIDFNRENLDTGLNPVATPNFITVDNTEKTINVGSSIGGQPDFGAVWFEADKAIGGKQDVCQAGACEFGRGVRVFFTLDYSGTADGLTFALINTTHNTTSSSGGDRNMGELLGYGGDSRKIANPTVTTDFLDVTGAGLSPPHPGLHPPKMALEFDTWTNNDNHDYCLGTDTKLNGNRNDPFNSNRDAVQYVFWGFTSLAMPCRNYTLSGTPVVDHPSYDDNRHDSGELDQPWTPYTTSGAVRSTPKIADDGTIYVGSDDGHLYAINPDGSLKWKSVDIGQVQSSPAIGLNGVVYVGTNNNWVYAFAKESGSPISHPVLYSFPTYGDVRSSPVIGTGGKVYVGSDDGHFYGLTPALAKEWEFHAAGPISYGRPEVSPSGIIYVSNRTETTPGNGFYVYALNPSQRELDPTGSAFPGVNEWTYPVGEGNQYAPGRDPATGTIYADASGNRIFAITPIGTLDWEFDLGSDFDSKPVVGSDGTVYFGTDNGILYAINPEDRNNGDTFPTAREWTFSTGGPVDTTPAIATDGSILVVSEDDNLYAVNPDGTEKWTFTIPVDGVEPTSSPTVGNEGIVYVGSSGNNKLYAINNYAVPRNYKDKVVTSVFDGSDVRVAGEIVTVDNELDWLNGDSAKGPWAVRLEVMRSLTPNADSNYEYTLHAWIRQCDSPSCGNIFATFFADTRIEYTAAPHLDQTIELDATEHTEFARFLFGFTGATGATTTQSALIADFKLSFIRENDPQAGD